MNVTRGDISRVRDAVIIHQVNCRGAIGAGVSGPICKRWPEVEEAYHKYCSEHTAREMHGRVLAVKADDVVICNAFTQLDYGNSARTGRTYTDEDKLVNAIRNVCAKFPDRAIAVPERIGCGLAGGDWDRVRSRLEPLPVNVVEFQPGLEPRLKAQAEMRATEKNIAAVPTESSHTTETQQDTFQPH